MPGTKRALRLASHLLAHSSTRVAPTSPFSVLCRDAAAHTVCRRYASSSAHTAAPACNAQSLVARFTGKSTWYPSLFRATFPNIRLSVPHHAWGVALSSPLLMRPVALSSGLPSLSSYTNVFTVFNTLSRSTIRYLLQNSRSGIALPTRAQIDARLRRSMELTLQTYSASAASVRLVLINAIQICGSSLPYALGALVAEFIQRQSSQCLAPPSHFKSDPTIDMRFELGGAPDSWQRWAIAVWREFSENLFMILHILRLFVLFSPLAATAPLAFYFDVGRAAWLQTLRETLEVAGPAFIKWGQWAATRHDMFPRDMCSELEYLQSSAPRHGWAHTKASIEKSFGMPLDIICDSIEEAPIASGSIGQIHKAVLSRRGAEVCGVPMGTVVAIKVKHPRVSQSIQRDFSLMMWLAAQMEWVPALKKLRLKESLQQFAGPLREQVDLSMEANTLWRFNQNFAKDRLVSLPMPLYPWISQDVLMQSFEEGMHISEYMVSDSDHTRRSAVANVGSQCMLNMMLVHNLIHSDLHPGNILVRWQLPEGFLIDVIAAVMQRCSTKTPEQMFAKWLQPHVVLLDVGMATELSRQDQINMFYLFKAFSELDGEAMAEHAMAFAGSRQGCRDQEGFKAAVAKKVQQCKVESWEDSQFSNSAEAFSSILDDVREYEVTLPGHIASVLVTTLVLEGWSSELAPEQSVLEVVKGMMAMDTQSWRERVSSTVDQWVSWAPALPAYS